MVRARRTEKELQDASNHVHYEFSMLMSVGQGLASGIARQGWLVNALLESFVIHFRTLVDFFYPPESVKAGDVLAADYFDDGNDWEKVRPALSEALIRARDRAHKEVAHLTYARLKVTPEAKGWAFLGIANEMQNLMGLFLEHVPKGRLASSWDRCTS